MKKTFIFLTDGFEDTEAVATIDVVRRAGISCVLVSLTGDLKVTGSNKMTVICDTLFEDENFLEFDALIIPGGPGYKQLNKHEPLKKMLVEANSNEKLLCAICAAPTVFSELGILKGKDATAYPSLQNELVCENVVDTSVVLSKNVITARGVGAVLDFGLKIVETLLDVKTMEDLKKAIVHY